MLILLLLLFFSFASPFTSQYLCLFTLYSLYFPSKTFEKSDLHWTFVCEKVHFSVSSPCFCFKKVKLVWLLLKRLNPLFTLSSNVQCIVLESFEKLKLSCSNFLAQVCFECCFCFSSFSWWFVLLCLCDFLEIDLFILSGTAHWCRHFCVCVVIYVGFVLLGNFVLVCLRGKCFPKNKSQMGLIWNLFYLSLKACCSTEMAFFFCLYLVSWHLNGGFELCLWLMDFFCSDFCRVLVRSSDWWDSLIYYFLL